MASPGDKPVREKTEKGKFTLLGILCFCKWEKGEIVSKK